MTTNHKEWNYEQFTAFMMMYMAKSDELDKEEKKIIREMFGKSMFRDMQKIVDKLDGFTANAIIDDLKAVHLQTQEDVDKLFVELQKIVEADGVVNFYEKQMLKKLHTMLDIEG